MQIYNIGWVGLIIGLFFTIKRYFLHSGELWILLFSNILLISTIFGSWIMQLTHLIVITAMSVQVLSMCKQTDQIIPQKKLNFFFKFVFHIQQELILFVYGIALWLVLKIYTTKTFYFGIGLIYENQKVFLGVNETLKGWNCTQIQFVIVPFLWTILNLTSYLVGNFIIKVQKDKDNLYKEFILKYKVIPDLVFSIIITVYNFYSYYNSSKLIQCCKYWQYGYFMQICEYLGFSASTLYLFYIKKGVFQLQCNTNSSDKASNEVMDKNDYELKQRLD